MSILQQINIKAIGYGSIILTLAYLLLTYSLNYIANTSSSMPGILMWLNFLVLFCFILCGYITAVLAKKSGILNGMVLGVISPFLVLLAMFLLFGSSVMLKSYESNWYYWFLMGLVTCGFGGLVWDLKKKFINVKP